nr:energy transducer TonB [Deltaproteobacteria bacterium]
CVLNNYEGACCKKYDKRISKIVENDDGIPEALDRTIITEGVLPVKTAIMACGNRFTAKGTVKVSVKVAPDGTPTSVMVKQSPDPSLGDCVARAMKRSRYAKTQAGGLFAYPFVF